MQASTVDTTPEPLASEDALGQTTVVIEELENGLHASQGTMLVGLIRDEVERQRVRALATAHSPALLEALTGLEHKSVAVCERDFKGQSTLTRLTDLPSYVDIVAKGGLGRAAVADRLRSVGQPKDPKAVLEDILGARWRDEGDVHRHLSALRTCPGAGQDPTGRSGPGGVRAAGRRRRAFRPSDHGRDRDRKPHRPAQGARREAAERLVHLLRAAMTGEVPFVLNQVAWDDVFLDALCEGDSTHQSFVDLAGNGLMGAGDLAILVERDQFVAASAFSGSDVRV
jgi:hypothetical protein